MKTKNKYKATLDKKGIILFDGYCNLCSWSVQFIIKRDKKDYFRFASLQSEIGKSLISSFGITEDFNYSVVLIENQSIYFKSEAALKITKRLRHLWPFLYIFIILPKVVRDAMYSFIAKNRFRWFGKRTSCYLPDKDLSYKFL